MKGSFDNIRIQGISTAVPPTVESNEIYGAVLGKRRVSKQIALTGVERRHISSSTQRASDLCYAASVRLLEHLKWKCSDIKILLFITQGEDFSVPSTAFLLQNRLNLPNDCVCFDINLGCTAFNVGIQTIGSMLQSYSIGTKGLLLIGDTIQVKSPYYSSGPDEVAKLMLFGSGGACVAVEKVTSCRLDYQNFSDGSRYKAIYGEYGLPSGMDGSAVFSFAVGDVADSLRAFRNEYSIYEDDIDFYAFHQAQQLILNDMAESCMIPPDKELRSYDRYGNTSGASVLVSLCANTDRIRKYAEEQSGNDIRFLLTGFGVGLSWGCVYTSVKAENILPIIECDDFYEFRPVSRSLHNRTIAVCNADSDLGEWITRFLIDHDAKVLLCGGNKARLKEIADAQYISVEYFADNLSTAERINEADTVVILVSNCNVDRYVSMLKDTACSDETNNIPVILVSDRAAMNMEGCKCDVAAYRHMESLFQECEHSGIGACHGVIYDSSTMNVIPIRDNGQHWFEVYVANSCPVSMTRASDVAGCIETLIVNADRYTNHTIINIEG
jgi:3-oxoacyl-[acyl-carrier-protein] synthase-3